jgi:hypothetical protein
MRLGQLARKLDIKVNEIVDFLKDEHNISIDSDLNTKIDGDALDYVVDNYKVEAVDVVEVVEAVEEVEIEESIEPDALEENNRDSENITEIVEEEIEIIADPNLIETVETENDQIEEVPVLEKEEKLVVESEDGEEIELNVVDGVIKAPKKELSGFKVVGKIKLEQPKKSVQHVKTEGDETTNITDEITAKRKEIAQLKREKYLKRKAEKKKQQENKKKGRKKRVLSELELKEKQAELLVKKRVEQSKVDKEKKRKHYEQLIKTKKTFSTNKKNKKKKKVDESVVKTVKQFEKEPTTTLGKIWKWFNT